LLDTVISNQWDLRFDVTVPKIIAFFSLIPQKMNRAMFTEELERDDVEEATMELVIIKENADALELLDTANALQTT
jgi:hypothetical protein